VRCAVGGKLAAAAAQAIRAEDRGRKWRTQLKPNSITLASSELAPNMFEAGSCQIPLH